ncbi:MAG: maltose O-acetyltransferase [Holophagaceae bacterium]|nr:maltose O-acetyltransferase [Holophagaceae bacterium]
MMRDGLPEWLVRLLKPVYCVPSLLRASWYLLGVSRGCRVRVLWGGAVRVRGASRIRLGDRVWFNRSSIPVELICGDNGNLLIGDGTGFNFGDSVQASQLVRIGHSCMFGGFTRVRDFDGHRTAPVIIGDRVWLARGAVIEPGVRIGDDAVISAGCVVLHDVPAGAIALGNPARCMPITSLRRNGSEVAGVESDSPDHPPPLLLTL